MKFNVKQTSEDCTLEISDRMVKINGDSISIKTAGHLLVSAPGMYESKIYCFGKELKMYECFVYSNLYDAMKYNKQILKQVAFWLRPFCTVAWKKV